MGLIFSGFLSCEPWVMLELQRGRAGGWKSFPAGFPLWRAARGIHMDGFGSSQRGQRGGNVRLGE